MRTVGDAGPAGRGGVGRGWGAPRVEGGHRQDPARGRADSQGRGGGGESEDACLMPGGAGGGSEGEAHRRYLPVPAWSPPRAAPRASGLGPGVEGGGALFPPRHRQDPAQARPGTGPATAGRGRGGAGGTRDVGVLAARAGFSVESGWHVGSLSAAVPLDLTAVHGAHARGMGERDGAGANDVYGGYPDHEHGVRGWYGGAAEDDSLAGSDGEVEEPRRVSPVPAPALHPIRPDAPPTLHREVVSQPREAARTLNPQL